jgi:hypothetical protein
MFLVLHSGMVFHFDHAVQNCSGKQINLAKPSSIPWDPFCKPPELCREEAASRLRLLHPDATPAHTNLLAAWARSKNSGLHPAAFSQLSPICIPLCKPPLLFPPLCWSIIHYNQICNPRIHSKLFRVFIVIYLTLIVMA